MNKKKINNKIPDPGTGSEGFMPGIAVDTVIFGFHDDQLKILVLKYRNTELFALPGGFVQNTEPLEVAAHRVLSHRTGLADIFLQQFAVFGSMERYDPGPMRTILRRNAIKAESDHWLLGRFISIGYYALVDFTKVIPNPDHMSESCSWYDLGSLPRLMQDHNDIVQKALEALRLNLDRQLIGYRLLPEQFTIGELQRLYETILGEDQNRSSFQRRMLSLGMLERIEKKYTGGAHKAPYLYRFL